MIRCKYVELRADNSFSICQFLCFTVTCLSFVNRNSEVFFFFVFPKDQIGGGPRISTF